MRKLFLSLAITLCFGAICNAESFKNDSIKIIFQEKQYKKIDVSSVDKAALEQIKKNYGTYTIKEAYKADDGEYKLVLNKDGVDLTATFTSAGDLIKIY
ncbi:hypothetical protein GR160_18265 [Flavobacterium sp. Sd200]|uniref:hypothetical protein n=1 Tax=Flavobacterium sp. Sd200 TaxID=2692211 RepID=UPI00136A251B|nr:hypothetical protein [Flavobacterium sp. Sd200]MXN93177.1 hypothetical protein [Flavobacterium sp. Sd200]